MEDLSLAHEVIFLLFSWFFFKKKVMFICRLSIRPFCSEEVHSLWAECRAGAWEPWMQLLLLCPDLSSRVHSDYSKLDRRQLEQRPSSVAGKCCAFPPFLPAALHGHNQAFHDTSLPNNFCLNVLPSKLF